MRRRSFLIVACSPALAMVLPACGDDLRRPDAGASFFRVANDDASGHQHHMEIHCADLASRSPVTYVATGPHEHTITLSIDQMERIAAGETVEVAFTEGHSHRFTIRRPDGLC